MTIIDDVIELGKCFPSSFITLNGELILDKKSNLYIYVANCTTREELICKLFEWCSRTLAKGVIYQSVKRNEEYLDKLLTYFNEFLHTSFTRQDMYWIYDKLGNSVNHMLTLEFIKSGYDLDLVYPKN